MTSKHKQKKRIVIGISGASGAILGIEALKILRDLGGYESHLIISSGAALTIPLETSYTVDEVMALADHCHDNADIGAAVASGSFRTMGMMVVPCSMKTVAGIAAGFSTNLLLRAADVTLKEARPLVLMPRECPLGIIHLRNLLSLAEAGAAIVPPMVTYYNGPTSLADMNHHLLGKALDRLGIDVPGMKRWGEDVGLK
ncbi:MAG: UbiX family flavin prenyltransferase [bacterium]|nr:UbiX family flavin prenyltransferase [bacterium]